MNQTDASPQRIRKFPGRTPYVHLLLPAIAFLALFYLIPLSWIIRVSFYTHVPGAYMVPAFTAQNYLRLVTDPWYIRNSLWLTLKVALISTLASVVLAYPPALLITRSTGKLRRFLLVSVLAPLLISMVCLIFGWIVMFRGHGLMNQVLLGLHLVREPVQWMYNTFGVTLALIYISIPYVVISLLDSLQRVDPSWEEAARNVGANGWQTFLKITLPLSIPGAVSGSMIALTLNICAFAVPLLLGGEKVPMAGLVAYYQALEVNNLPFGAAISVMLLLASLLVIFVFQKVLHALYLKRMEVS